MHIDVIEHLEMDGAIGHLIRGDVTSTLRSRDCLSSEAGRFRTRLCNDVITEAETGGSEEGCNRRAD